MDVLTHSLLFRAGSNSGSISVQERTSIDFHVNDTSLLASLIAQSGGKSDLMGCIVKGDTTQNAATVARLMTEGLPDTKSGRVIIYTCPECKDIGCGAYSAKIQRTEKNYIWREFAYENGYEDPVPIKDIGPFYFEKTQYESEIHRAGAL